MVRSINMVLVRLCNGVARHVVASCDVVLRRAEHVLLPVVGQVGEVHQGHGDDAPGRGDVGDLDHQGSEVAALPECIERGGLAVGGALDARHMEIFRGDDARVEHIQEGLGGQMGVGVAPIVDGGKGLVLVLAAVQNWLLLVPVEGDQHLLGAVADHRGQLGDPVPQDRGWGEELGLVGGVVEHSLVGSEVGHKILMMTVVVLVPVDEEPVGQQVVVVVLGDVGLAHVIVGGWLGPLDGGYACPGVGVGVDGIRGDDGLVVGDVETSSSEDVVHQGGEVLLGPVGGVPGQGHELPQFVPA